MKTFSSVPPWNGTPARLLVFFFEHPTGTFYESEVRRQVRISAGAVNKHLKSLAEHGYLTSERKGNMNFYRLNRTSGMVRDMKAAWNMSLPLAGKLKDAARELDVKIYLYGSTARGEDIEDSDWDILVIGTVPLTEIEGKFNDIRKTSKRKLSLMVFTSAEWLAMWQKDPAFYERVEKDKKELT